MEGVGSSERVGPDREASNTDESRVEGSAVSAGGSADEKPAPEALERRLIPLDLRPEATVESSSLSKWKGLLLMTFSSDPNDELEERSLGISSSTLDVR